MDIEHDIKVITLDDKLPSEVENLAKEGWQLVPGVKPVAIYHVVRDKSRMINAGGKATLTIDESKIMILRNGQLIPS